LCSSIAGVGDRFAFASWRTIAIIISEIRSAGATVVTVSVDAANTSEALRIQLSLPFPILCETQRRVVRDWDIFNAREKSASPDPPCS
jgi:peroxiredoxin